MQLFQHLFSAAAGLSVIVDARSIAPTSPKGDLLVKRAPGSGVAGAQEHAPDYLTKISARADKYQELMKAKKYYYPEDAGSEVTIYFLDSGLNAEHPEVQKYEHESGHKVEFLNTKDFDGNVYPANKDPTGHGSCVWAHAVSPTYGTAKKAKTVMVNYWQPAKNTKEPEVRTPTHREQTQCDAMEAIEEDIVKKHTANPKAKFVVNISHAFGFTDCPRKTIDRLLADLDALKVVLVVFSAGNGGRLGVKVPIWKKQWQQTHKNVVVIGGSDNKNHRYEDSREPLPGQTINAYAQGMNLECIAGQGSGIDTGEGEERKEGTSYAAPQGAGVAATMWMEKGFNTAEEVRDHLTKLAHKRDAADKAAVDILYNGYEEGEGGSCKFHKRQLLVSGPWKRTSKQRAGKSTTSHSGSSRSGSSHSGSSNSGTCKASFNGQAPSAHDKTSSGKHEDTAPGSHNAGSADSHKKTSTKAKRPTSGHSGKKAPTKAGSGPGR